VRAELVRWNKAAVTLDHREGIVEHKYYADCSVYELTAWCA
jgi:hypothetical protein